MISECGHVERIIFNSNMIDAYRREYENVPDEHEDHQGNLFLFIFFIKNFQLI